MVFGKNSVWLAGPSVSRDLALIRAIRTDHVITLIGAFEPSCLRREAALRSADLIVVEYGAWAGEASAVFDAIAEIKKKFEGLVVLLVGGQLEQEEVIRAHKSGIEKDGYFPSPYISRLLAEKILVHCRRKQA
jgi:hypothetical protein